MTKLYIDNVLADMDPSTDLAISITPETLGSSNLGVVCSKSVTIPSTPHNRGLMGDCGHPYSRRMFNHSEHRARLEVRGCVVLEGRLHLVASATGPNGYYRFYIVPDGVEWHKALDRSIDSAAISWSSYFSISAIRDSWTQNNPIVRFLPVERGTGKGKMNYCGRILTENYHPFIHLGSLLRAMFAEAGYAIESEFLDSDFFRSLYMSGRWSERNWRNWSDKMDFKAVRATSSPVTTADYFGRIYASPLKHYHTVGNIVDVPSSDSPEGAFNEGCFGLEESSGRICFTPIAEMMVAFDYDLRWRTEYRIASRTEFKGVSGACFSSGDREKLILPNNLYDYRNDPLGVGYAYNLMIFEVTDGTTYRLLADETMADGTTQTHELLSTTQRFTPFVNTYSNPLTNLRMEGISAEGTPFSFAKDWAIYDGCVEERGSVDLRMNVRTYPRVCSPEEPLYFDEFFFEGGEQDMEVEVLEGCSVQPVFYPNIQLNKNVEWSDVAALSFTGMELLTALQELFDLQVQTDPCQRTVRIAPRREFCDGGVVDMSERIDLSKPIVVEELGDEQLQTLRLAYRSGDKVIEEWKEEQGKEYGEWSGTICNVFAGEGTRSIENSIFTASLSEQGAIAAAPSASLIIAHPENSSAPRCVQLLNFLPKIVSYRGVQPLAEGEAWNYPRRGETNYPLVTFFDDGSLGGEPRSLLFEDRNGVEGLRRWWSGLLARYNHSRRLTLHLHLNPEDVEPFVAPNGLGRDFRSLYLVSVEGEKVLCHLEKICNYNPNEPSTEVVLVTVSEID